MKRNILFLLPLVFGIVFSGISHAVELHVSAAASMADVFKELAAGFSARNPGVSVLPNFGSSGALAKQIAQGAPADLFVSANPKWMDYLVTEGKIAPRTVRVLAHNTLVVVGPRASAIPSLAALASLARIAMGSPRSVPAGQYAEQAMRAAGVYEQLLKQHKLVMAKDVRQALLYADRGEVDGAFVYKTDALLAEKAVILYVVPENLHERISYPMGLTVHGEKNAVAKAFYAYLASAAARRVLEKYGFDAPEPAAHGN